MSFSEVIAAYKIKAGSAANKAVLVSLAKFANKDTHEAWPKISTIVAETELSVSTVKRSLCELVERGLLKREAQYGRYGRKPDIYTLTLEPRCQGDTHPRCQGDTNQTEPRCHPEQPRCHGDTSKYHRSIKEESLSRSATPTVDDSFEEFWKAYPKRDGSNPKLPAKQKFAKAVRNGTNPQVIIAGMKRYAAEQQRLGKIDTPYIAMAKTWLNQECWTDDAPTTTSTAPAEKPSRVFYPCGSENFKAWDEHFKKLGKGGAPEDDIKVPDSSHYGSHYERGWRFETPWPPGYEPPLVVPVAQISAGAAESAVMP